MKFVWFTLILVFYFTHLLLAQSDDKDATDESKLRPDWSYCYEFTWFGPEYDNVTTYNGTCSDYLDDTRAVNIPCSPPIVITYDGTPPDLDYLWENHKASVLCRRSDNQVCVKYTYFYNGKLNNATYMCTKVQSLGGGPITSGCFTQSYEGYDVELCVCESSSGIYQPCNSGTSLTVYVTLILIVQTLFMLLR